MRAARKIYVGEYEVSAGAAIAGGERLVTLEELVAAVRWLGGGHTGQDRCRRGSREGNPGGGG